MHLNDTEPGDYRAITDASRYTIKICGQCRDAGHYKTYGKNWNAHWEKNHPNEAKWGWVVIELLDGTKSELNLDKFEDHKKKKMKFETNYIVKELRQNEAALVQGLKTIKKFLKRIMQDKRRLKKAA